MKKVPAKPLLVVRVYPTVKTTGRWCGLYCKVIIWPTRKQMIEYCRTEHYLQKTRWTQGLCSPMEIYRFKKGAHRRKNPLFAEVNLYKGNLGSEPITHELLHATLAWARRVKIEMQDLVWQEGVSPTEERVCYVHGRMVRQLVHRLYKKKFYG